MVTDPICKMKIDVLQAASQSDYEGKTYFFCSVYCKDTFEENPDQYAETTQETEKSDS